MSAAVALVVLATACSSTTKKVVPKPVPTTVVVNHDRDALDFRVVQGSLPYTAGPETTVLGPPGADCHNGKLVTPAAQVRAAARVVLADRAKSTCYELGPSILTGHDIVGAQAVQDETSGEWTVNLHFANNDFVTKVAQPYVNQQIAIVFHDVVESAPTINIGITGQDVTVSGSFDEATARDIARRLS